MAEGHDCSNGIRLELEAIHKDPNISKHESRFRWRSQGSMTDTVFALCPAGWSCWSMRLYHALCVDAIPVILADRIIEPFERFLDWETFTVKYTTANKSSVIGMFDELHSLAEQARGSPQPENTVVYNKLRAVRSVVQWLQFNGSVAATRSAYRLLTLELWCRTSKGSSNPSCRRPVSVIANSSYL